MVLKSSRMHGFKSFASPVGVEFANNITGIIGPNGCGKSNVVDALRFALGEQSLRLMRAKCLDDLIFAGNARCPATSLGTVSITFDNATRWLDTDYKEVELKREIGRNGDSKYFLNGTHVRLKDIQKIFTDVGVNRGKYCIIGQNQVQTIVSSSPEDRRLLLEEAAGVMGYRQNKKETLRRLEEVQTNLDQVQLLLNEYSKQMHGLKIQAGRAEKYLEYQKEYRAQLLGYSHRQYRVLAAQAGESQERQSHIHARLASADSAMAELESRISELTAGRQAAMDRIGAVETELQEAESVRSQCDRELAGADERKHGVARQINEADIRFGRIRELMREIERKIEDHPERLKIEHELQELVVLTDQARSWLEAQQQEQASLEAEYGALSGEERRLLDEHAASKENAAAMSARFDALVASAEDLRGRVSALQADAARIREHMLEFQRERGAAAEVRADAAAQQERAEIEAKELERAVSQSRDELLHLRASNAEQSGQLRSLEAAEQSMMGVAPAVKAVLREFECDAGCLGMVRDLISFEDRYARAVESVLGPRLQNLVALDSATAHRMVESAKHKSGRVTIWALDLVQPPITPPQKPEVPGVIAWADEIIQVDERLSRLFKSMLGRALVVEDESVLMALARDHKNISIVTLEGTFYRAGSLTAGKPVAPGLLERKVELTKAREDVGQLGVRLSTGEEQLDGLTRKLIAARAAAEAAYHRVKDADGRLHKLDANIDSAVHRGAAISTALESEQTQLEARMKSAELLQAELGELRGRLQSPDTSGLREQMAGVRSAVDRLKEGVAQSESSLRELEERRHDRLRAKAQWMERMKADRERLDELEAELIELGNRRLVLRCDTVEQERTRLELTERLAQSQTAVAGLRDRRRALREETDALDRRVTESRDEASKFGHEVDRIRDEYHENEVKLMSWRKDMENLRERVREDLGLDIDAVREDDVPAGEIDPQTVGARLAELRTKMQRIGSVNLDAIEEFKQVEAKHNELAAQQDDLLRGRDNLKDVLRKTDRACKEKFAETFNRVAQNFQEVSKKLFMGGEGKLLLTNPEDLLESGVDIQLRPPGKKFTSIALLSGGEQSLAGISLLFSMFMEKPSPFCVLDEVDAALDDVNVGRLARVIEEFSQKIQFIIVTHNKLTMQICQALYGATMEEAGITKLLSVRLKQAEAALAAAS